MKANLREEYRKIVAMIDGRCGENFCHMTWY